MKKLLNNYIYNTLYQILSIIIPLITTPYLTRVLGSHSLGVSTYVLSIVTMYQTIGNLGMDTYCRREIAYTKARNSNLKTSFYELFLIRSILLIITLVAYIPFLFGKYALFYKINILTMVGLFLDISWFFIGIEEMKIVVIRNIIIRLITTIMIFLLIKRPSDLTLYIFIYAISQIISTISIFPNLKKYFNRQRKGKISIRKHLRPIILLFLPQAASTIYIQFDKIMLGSMTSNIVYVTLYEKAETISKIPLKFIIALSAVMLPRTSSLFATGQDKKIRDILSKVASLSMMLLLPTVIGLIAIADIFLPLYLGREYIGSIAIIRVVAFEVIAIALSNITGIQYLMAVNETKILTLSYTFAGVSNFILNYFLIPHLNAIGASIATVVAEWSVFIIQYGYMRHIGISLNLTKNLIKRLISVLCMAVCLLIIRIYVGSTYISGLIQIVVGIFIYFIILYLEKDSMLYSVLKKIKLKINL